jgi:hypothetical protein
LILLYSALDASICMFQSLSLTSLTEQMFSELSCTIIALEAMSTFTISLRPPKVRAPRS